MADIALITLSDDGAMVAGRLSHGIPGSETFVHEIVRNEHAGTRFRSIVALTQEIFNRYSGLVYIVPCGVAVRAVAGNIRHKTTDPAVVVVDVYARFAVSLLSGHEGGANDLALHVANILGAEPVITTTTEARKNLVVGIGCKRGTPAERIIDAIAEGLREANLDLDQVRLLASADIKSDEEGLRAAARQLGIPLRFISSDEIRNTALDFQQSDFVQEKVNLPAVAEPAALLAGRRTRLVLKKRRYNGITVAVAKESCLS